MQTHRVGIIMNGVTGRMGSNQHLLRAVAAIRQAGGLPAGPDALILPEPILLGRNPQKLQTLAGRAGIEAWSNDLDACLGDPRYPVYFDAQITGLRAEALTRAIAAGKHIYCEKPTATDTETALALYRACHTAGLKNGVVQDKLWLPGMIKLNRLRQNDFFGRILAVNIDFGYWVFEGHSLPAQRPSWNYRHATHGGILLDMMPHIRYLLDRLCGPVRSVSGMAAVHLPERIDEDGRPFVCDVEDAAYLTLTLEGGAIARVTCSWTTRVRRDDLLTVQIDGTRGSAVAGLRECYTQHYGNTPRPVWDPERPPAERYADQWGRVPDQEDYPNPFRAQWECFLRHVVRDAPFPWNLREGAKGVQLAEAAHAAWRRRQWVDIPELAMPAESG